MGTLAETIKEITRKHLEKDRGRLYAQCVKAVGWIGGTVPDTKNIVELPTSDVSNGGVVVGAALAGERPIYVVRYQGFLPYNMITILNYAAKSKEMWNTPCPVLIRALSMEGSMGPVASNAHHSIVLRMPGINVLAPMTPIEWQIAYERFMQQDYPMFLSESRLALNKEAKDFAYYDDGYRPAKHKKCAVFLIGAARFAAQELVKHNDLYITQLFDLNGRQPTHIYDTLYNSDFGIVVDADYSVCGVSEHLANIFAEHTRKQVITLGIPHHTAGFARDKDTNTPNAEDILKRIRDYERHF